MVEKFGSSKSSNRVLVYPCPKRHEISDVHDTSSDVCNTAGTSQADLKFGDSHAQSQTRVASGEDISYNKSFPSSSLRINSQSNNAEDKYEMDEDSSFLFEPLLDYSLNKDGSVTCRICKETVPSRTHWYRHKYKVVAV